MFKTIFLLALASSVAQAADVYTVRADTMVCTTEEAYEEQSLLLSAGLADAVRGCGELMRDVRVVVLDMQVFGPSYVRSLDPVVRFWVGTTDLQR